MDRDRLNFFAPFERAPPNHENQLTRALLVVLRMSPIAHLVWLRLIGPEKELHRLPPATFDTQRGAIRRAGDSDEQADLISVYLASEEPLSTGVVTEHDRAQVLDAVIDYGGELLVVVENKIADADDWQARNLNTTGAKVTIAPGQEVIVVLWRDLLEAFVSLRERQLVGGAEAALLDDFLTYVEDQFAALGPFRTLALCRGNHFRQARRLRQVLGDAAGTEAKAGPYGPYVATPAGHVIGANAYLNVRDEQEIELALYPADTLTQARVFYRRPSAIHGLRHLAERDAWHAGPNFHFGHYERGFCWTCNRIDLHRYLDLWSERIDTAVAVERDRWDAYWEWLEREHIACPQDRAAFDRHFTHTHRSSAVPRPGLWLSRRWSVDEAEQLDSRGVFAAHVREALDEALAAFGEPALADMQGTSSGQVPSST